ncbi:MAG: hypothetical protein K6U11_04410 [bacterium]|nr:hypothetical protein [bacterium]
MKSFLKLCLTLCCCGLFFCAWINPCAAQGKAGKYGFGIKDTVDPEEAFTVIGRYWFSDRLALDGNFGFRYIDVNDDKANDYKRFLFGIGLNQYLLGPQKFNPFVGLDFLVRADDLRKGETDTTSELDGKFGGEYFLAERFSLSAEALLKLRFGDEDEFGTGGRLGMIFYLN